MLIALPVVGFRGDLQSTIVEPTRAVSCQSSAVSRQLSVVSCQLSVVCIVWEPW